MDKFLIANFREKHYDILQQNIICLHDKLKNHNGHHCNTRKSCTTEQIKVDCPVTATMKNGSIIISNFSIPYMFRSKSSAKNCYLQLQESFTLPVLEHGERYMLSQGYISPSYNGWVFFMRLTELRQTPILFFKIHSLESWDLLQQPVGKLKWGTRRCHRCSWMAR
jgi:hypothetical protein